MSIDSIDYRYHAVGQGLFASGALVERGPMRARFRWVYDCGTVSGNQLVIDGINDMASLNDSRQRLDLVTISHFDKDHISGLAELLGHFPVDTLMLPYATLAARLALAFAQGVTSSDPVFRLFADPVGYIRALDGGRRIGRILFVPPSDGEAVPPPPDAPEEMPGIDGEEGDFEFRLDTEALGDTEASELMIDGDADQSPRAELLRRGGRLRVEGLWEFVPYNNADLLPPDLEDFARAVGILREELLAAAAAWRAGQGTPGSVHTAVATLKLYYDARFGSDAVARNLISLFLYAGPLPGLRLHDRNSLVAYQPGNHRHWDHPRRVAQLFSGDGYLDSRERLDALVRHFSEVRIDRVGIFQVMHHGAGRNWHKGVAGRLAPLISVFSSDPERGNTYHPKADVLRDFWSYGPTQVDLRSSLHVEVG